MTRKKVKTEKNEMLEDTFSVEKVFNEINEKLKKHYNKQLDVVYKSEIVQESTMFTHEEFVKKVKDGFTDSYGVNF